MSERQPDLPDNSKLEILKTNIIEELDDDFFLVTHPFPQMEGEMLIFQNTLPTSKLCFNYPDYSLIKRATASSNAKPNAQQSRIIEKNDMALSKLLTN